MRVLRKRDVASKCGVSASTIDRWTYEGRYRHLAFPKPGTLDGVLRVWDETEVDEWLRDRLAQSRSSPNREAARAYGFAAMAVRAARIDLAREREASRRARRCCGVARLGRSGRSRARRRARRHRAWRGRLHSGGIVGTRAARRSRRPRGARMPPCARWPSLWRRAFRCARRRKKYRAHSISTRRPDGLRNLTWTRRRPLPAGRPRRMPGASSGQAGPCRRRARSGESSGRRPGEDDFGPPAGIWPTGCARVVRQLEGIMTIDRKILAGLPDVAVAQIFAMEARVQRSFGERRALGEAVHRADRQRDGLAQALAELDGKGAPDGAEAETAWRARRDAAARDLRIAELAAARCRQEVGARGRGGLGWRGPSV